MLKNRNFLVFLTAMVVFVSCQVENPGPESFLRYGYPGRLGMDVTRLENLDNEITNGNFGQINSLIILRKDRIVYEKYYSTYNRTDLQPLGSATQSIVSTVLGVALHQGRIPDITAKIVDLLPDYQLYFQDVPQKDQIEVRHLMSHMSGFWWDERSKPFGSDENDAYIMSQSDDWIASVLATPMIKEPGREFNFNSGNAVLMAPVFETGSGMDIEEFASKNLFAPLEIVDWKWDRIPGGMVNAAWGLHMRPMDLAKIGYLYVNKGIWESDRIFSEFWHMRASRSRVRINGYYNYAYFFWRFTENADALKYIFNNDIFFAFGEGGQYLFIAPHLDLVVVCTASNFDDETAAIRIVRDYIFPAVVDRYM